MSTVGPGSGDLIAGAIGAGTPPNAAPHAMHAHRLWISLWMSWGNQRENSGHPGGNAGVTSNGRVGLHSRRPLHPGQPQRLCMEICTPAWADAGYPQDPPTL